MKKTMLALMATVGLAFGAKADGAVLNSTGFEYDTFGVDRNDSGEQAIPFMWSAATTNGSEATSLACAVTNYADAASKPTNLPDAFADAGDKYLAVDTSGEVLYRNVNVRQGNSYELGEPESIGDGLFFDSDVQFTATDSTGTPEPTAGDKLIVWLSGDDDGNTNLIVTATETYSLNKSQGPVNFTNNNENISVKDSEWHRLTVAAANENDMTTFKVYIDGELVTAEGVSDGKFKSLVGKGDSSSTYATLTAVGFMGTGAIDNLVWTTENPFPVVPPTTVALTVDPSGEDYSSLVYIVGESTTTNEVDGTAASIEADVDDVVTFVLTVADGYTPAVTGYVLQKGEGQVDEFSDVYYPYTFTETVTQAMIDGGLTLTITVTKNGGGEDPTPVEPGVPTVVEAESSEAAIAKATKAVPAAVQTAVGDGAAEYLALFELVATETAPDSGSYNVEMKLTAEGEASLEEDADEGVETLLAAVNALTGEQAEASSDVEVPAGFYWALSSGTTLEGMANDAGNTPSTGTVNLRVTKGELDTAGFYQLFISPTPIPSTKE